MAAEDKKLNVKKLVIVSAVLPALVIITCSVVIYITVMSLVPKNGLAAEKAEKPDLISAPENLNEAENMVKNLLETAADSGILKIDSSVSAELCPNEEENGGLMKILALVKGALAERLCSKYKLKNTKFGEDSSFIKNILPACGASDFSCEENEGLLTIVLVFPELKGTDFENEDRETAKTAVEENREIFEVSDAKAPLESVKYTAVVEKKEGEILSVSAERIYNISASVALKNELSSENGGELFFKGKITTAFNFSRAGIDIAQDKIILGKNGYENLSIEAAVEKNAAENDFSLVFSSSDPATADVNENGTVDAVSENALPAIITARLNYLGRTFTDTCTIYVLKEVKKVKLNKSRINLEKNGAFALTAKIKPDDATIKDIVWSSENEKIASVDKNGNVKAISPGETKIYAFSADGVHAAACGVRVE